MRTSPWQRPSRRPVERAWQRYEPRPRGLLIVACSLLVLAGCADEVRQLKDPSHTRSDDTRPRSPTPDAVSGVVDDASGTPRPVDAIQPRAEPDGGSGPALPALHRPPGCPDKGCAWGEHGFLPTPQGYVNRWLLVTPRGKGSRRLDKRPQELSPQQTTVLAAAGPAVSIRTSRQRGEVRLLRARVWSETARQVVLRLGVQAKLRLWVGGKRVFTADDRYDLLLDEHPVVVQLAAGWTPVEAVVARATRRTPIALAMRVHNPDGSLPGDLVWSIPERAAELSSICHLLEGSVTRELGPNGWSLRGEVQAHGLLPRSPAEHRVTLEVRPPEGGDALAKEVIEARLPELLDGSRPTIALELPNLKRGTYLVGLRVDSEACLEERLYSRPKLEQRIVAASGRLARVFEERSELPRPARESLEHHEQETRRLAATDKATRYVERWTSDLEELLGPAERGQDPYAARTGVVTRAYRSQMDHQLRRYVMSVPRSYAKRPEERFPLVVGFHGIFWDPEDLLANLMGVPTKKFGALKRARLRRPQYPDLGALVVSVDGYGDIGHRVSGPRDVLRVLDEVRASYRVDDRRVSLTGLSLGGSVAFYIPLHYADRFAATSPLVGYPNLKTFGSVIGKPRRPWETVVLNQLAIVNYCDNGLHLPMLVVHGGKDNPGRARGIVNRYRALGQRVEFDIQPELGHNVWDYAYENGKMVRRLRRFKLPERPAHTRLRTTHYRWVKNFWLRLDRFEDQLAAASLDGRRQSKRGRVEVRTENAAAFTILTPEMLAAPEPLELVVDGQQLGTIGRSLEPIFLARRDHRWTIVDARDLPPGHKRRGLSGPINDLWLEPFTIVYGTRDPAQSEANRLTARHFRRFHWKHDISMPIRADHEVTPAELAGRAVVLIGNPRSNSITAAAVAKLPVKFHDTALELAGRRFEGANVGVSLIYPSPFDPERYLVLHAGVAAEGTLLSRNLPAFLPDYLVYDERVRVQQDSRLLDKREALAGGFFGQRWEAPATP